MRFIPLGAAVAVLGSASPAFAKKGHRAHEHGAATVDIAVDGTAVLIGFSAPGDDIFGFEHPAQSAQEKQAVKDSLAKLRSKTDELFLLPKDAGCRVSAAKVEAAQDPDAEPASRKKAAPDEHADVDADFAFACQKPPAGGTLHLALLQVFPRIKTVKVQVISGATQSGQTVKSEQDAIKL